MVSRKGFPDGARCTPVPDLFFSRYLPELADPVAIKVMLHALWRIARRPTGELPALRADELAADPTLRRGLAALGLADEAIGAAVAQALDGLVAIGLLCELSLAGAEGPQRWVLVNGREGRAAASRLQTSELALPDRPPAVATAGAARPNIFSLYEQNIGLLTPMLAEELREAEAEYPLDWIEDAFRLAVESNVRKWVYIRAILERWVREGRDDESHRRDSQTTRERDSEGPYAAYIQH